MCEREDGAVGGGVWWTSSGIQGRSPSRRSGGGSPQETEAFFVNNEYLNFDDLEKI